MTPHGSNEPAPKIPGSMTSDFILGPSPKIYKNYKSKPPEETLQWIQNLLQPYFLPFISVRLQPNEFGSTWFCRVSLIHEGIGQNGKGATIPLALASGFAEFMERLQALYLLRNFSSTLPRLVRASDELPGDESTLWREFNKSLHEEINDRLLQDDSTFYTFYDALCGTTVYLDSSFTYTPFLTTGTAAGNTREEAFVQALCELFERYATRKIVESRKTVPSIPWNLLSERIQAMLHEIENAGFEVYVKDFSLGMGLPVVCVMVGTSELGYHARPGCAPDLNVAVERCILEFYQGVPSTAAKIAMVRELTERWKGLYSVLSHYVAPHFTLDEFLIVNFLNAYDFPPDDLKFLTRNAPGFIPWDYPRTDFYDEIQILLDLCRKNKFRIYVRDIGWMGFPTVQVLSPDLKAHEFNSVERQVLHSEKLTKFQHLLLKGLDSVRTPQFYELLVTPEVLYFLMVHNPPRVDCLRGLAQEGFWVMNSYYFLGLVAYYFQDVPLSQCFFECYRISHPQDEYSGCLIEFMRLLPSDPWDGSLLREDVEASLRQELVQTFSLPVVEEVLSDLRNPKKVLDILGGVIIPCEKCETCQIASMCSYGRILPVLDRLEKDFSIFRWENFHENP